MSKKKATDKSPKKKNNYGNRLQEVLRNIIIKKKKRCDYE